MVEDLKAKGPVLAVVWVTVVMIRAMIRRLILITRVVEMAKDAVKGLEENNHIKF
jgi:hypothetical protein